MKKTVSVALVMLFAVAFVAASWLESNAQTGKGKAAGKPAAKASGDIAALYKQHCQKCHAADGKGIESLEPPDLTNAEWQAKHTDKQFADAIRDGKEVMPGYKDKLTAAQITAMVKYVRAFAAKK